MLLAAPMLAALVAAGPSPSPTPAASPAPIGSVTVVSGSSQSLHRVPQAASLLDARTLRASTAPSLDQALRALPGFDRDRSDAPFTNYGQLRLSFAGAGGDRGALLVDGVPAQDGFGGQVDWNAYPATALARAELMRGPGSALYGSGAIGGVLALLTTPPAAGANGALELSGGGIDKGSATLTSTAAIGGLTSAFTLSSRRLGFDVIPSGQTSRVDEPATSRADVAHARLRRSTARATLDLDALAADDAQSDGRPNDGFSRRMRQAAATWTSGTRATLALTAFARETQLTNLADLYPQTPGALRYTQQVPSSDAGLRARWDVPLRDGGFALVAERRLATGRSEQFAANGATQSDVAGTQRLDGVAVQRTWDGRLGAIAGLRYDAIATRALGAHEDAALSPRLALRYDLSPATAVRAAFGTGLRAPYLNELVRSFRVGAVLERNNPNLVPERSRSAQLGIDIATASSRLAVDYTGTRVRDAIGFQTIAKNVQQRANFGGTATDAYTAEYDRGGPCARVRAFATAQHDRVVSGGAAQIGKRLAYVPDAAASLGVERTVRNVTGALEASYSGATFADDLEQQPLGNALVLGGRLTLHGANGVALSLALDNLADRVYLTSVDRVGPPSSLTLRLSVPVGASATPAAACARP